MNAPSATLRRAQLQALATAIDAGGSGGVIRIYAHPRTTIDATPNPTQLLVALQIPKPCTAYMDAQMLRLHPPAERLCVRTGTATWARLLDGDGQTLIDLDIGPLGSGADMELDSVLLLAGAVFGLPVLAFYSAES